MHEGVESTAEPANTTLEFDTAFTLLIFYLWAITILKFRTHNSSVLPNEVSLKRVVHAEIPTC